MPNPYTEYGPEGMLEGKRAIVVVTSAGTRLRSKMDFASDYLCHVPGFIGIEEVTFIEARQSDRTSSESSVQFTGVVLPIAC